VSLADVATTALLDTGASLSCVSAHWLTRLPTKAVLYKWNGGQIAGASGAALDVQGFVRLPVRIGATDAVLVPLIVVTNLCHQLILGVDTLARLGLVVDFQRMQLRLPSATAEPIPFEVANPTSVSIASVNNIVLKPFSSHTITVQTNIPLPPSDKPHFLYRHEMRLFEFTERVLVDAGAEHSTLPLIIKNPGLSPPTIPASKTLLSIASMITPAVDVED
jgi:hypothetical protein